MSLPIDPNAPVRLEKITLSLRAEHKGKTVVVEQEFLKTQNLGKVATFSTSLQRILHQMFERVIVELDS
jgi:hypothetical protein